MYAVALRADDWALFHSIQRPDSFALGASHDGLVKWERTLVNLLRRVDYEEIVRREPLIPIGPPLDYVPKAKQPAR